MIKTIILKVDDGDGSIVSQKEMEIEERKINFNLADKLSTFHAAELFFLFTAAGLLTHSVFRYLNIDFGWAAIAGTTCFLLAIIVNALYAIPRTKFKQRMTPEQVFRSKKARFDTKISPN